MVSTMTSTDVLATHPRHTVDLHLQARGSSGDHDAWGDARVLGPGPVADLLPGEVLIVDELTTDLLGFLPICAAVIIGSAGPWESPIPGIIHDDFSRSGAAALLRSLDIPHAWDVPGATAAVRTGDLVRLDPATGTLWTLAVG